MSAPEKGKRFKVHQLKAGQPVPCDGRIYCDEHGQLWFGILHPLEHQVHYLRLLREAERADKQKELDESGS